MPFHQKINLRAYLECKKFIKIVQEFYKNQYRFIGKKHRKIKFPNSKHTLKQHFVWKWGKKTNPTAVWNRGSTQMKQSEQESSSIPSTRNSRTGRDGTHLKKHTGSVIK